MSTKLKEKLNNLVREEKLPLEELKKYLLAFVSDPWEGARGLLKKYRINPLRYQKAIRKEWN